MCRLILPRLVIDLLELNKAYLLPRQLENAWYVTMKIFGPSFFLSWKALYLAMVGFFVFCQIIGFMCGVPDVSLASETSVSSKNAMTCPMDGTIVCPPSVTSSPERQIKHSMLDVDHVTILLSSPGVLIVPSASTLWSWSNTYSIVPVSIGSSSVLRI